MTVKIEMFKNSDRLMDSIKLFKNKKNLIVFDDSVNLRNQDKMKSFFTRGRHSNCNCIYLSQNYYDLDKNSIRGNSNFYVFFKLPNKDRDMICRDLFASIMGKELFYEECRECWKNKHCSFYCLALHWMNLLNIFRIQFNILSDLLSQPRGHWTTNCIPAFEICVSFIPGF